MILLKLGTRRLAFIILPKTLFSFAYKTSNLDLQYAIITSVNGYHYLLDDWICYHKNIGIQRIFLNVEDYEKFNHQKYANEKILTIINDTDEIDNSQINNFMWRQGKHVNYVIDEILEKEEFKGWIFHIDLDEMIYIPE